MIDPSLPDGGPTTPAGPPGRVRRRWWHPRRLGLLLLVAVLLWLAVDGFVVRSGSMAPLLHGDPDDGDRVLVLRPYYRVASPSRFDLVVFRTPPSVAAVEGDAPGLMIKRVVAFAGETVALRGGDLLIDGKIWRKPRDQFASILIPVATWRCGEEDRPEGFHADPRLFRPGSTPAGDRALVCDARDRRPGDRACMLEGPDVRDEDPTGPDRPGAVRGNLVGDLRLRARFVLMDDLGWVEARLQEEADLFRVRIGSREAGGGVTLYHSQAAGSGNVAASDDRFAGLEAGRTYELDFFNIDNRIGVYLDGHPLLDAYSYETNTPLAGGAGRNRPALGAPGARVAFLRIAVERDIHWLARGRLAEGGLRVTDSHLFVLGDNSGISLDSRDPRLGDVPLDQLTGRPFLIFYPFSRIRWL